MGKNKSWIILLCFICWWNSSTCQPLLRQELVKAANTYVGIREKTGNNDGADVESILANVGLGKGSAWCAALQSQIFDDVNIPNPHSAWSPDWFKTNVVYKRGVKTIKPFESKQGQVFGLYFETKKRVAHVGMIVGETKFNYETIEGNTNDGGSRDGDGCYKMIRNKRSIYIISDHVLNGVKTKLK